MDNPNLLFDLCSNLMPRRFIASNQHDRLIYEENDEVAEMYFITKGKVAFATNEFRSKMTLGNFDVFKINKGSTLICDHEAINRKRTECHYLAV